MRHSRWVTITALIGVLALVGAACSKNKTASSGGPSTDCTAAPGCVTVKAGDPIELGTLLAISGTHASLGTDSAHGVALALDYLDGKFDGKPGQVLGHDIKLVNEDDGCSTAGGQSGVAPLAADPQMFAVIGTSCSSAAFGVADKTLSAKGVILLSPSNTGPGLTASGSHQPYYFRTAHNDLIQGAVVSDFVMQKLHAKTAATIHDESPYAQGLTEAFTNNFTGASGTITDAEAITSTDTDFKALLSKIAIGKPNVLYYPDFTPACSYIAKQGAAISGLSTTAFIGSDGCADDTYMPIGGPATNGTYLSGPDLTSFAQGTFFSSQYLPAYKKQFPPGPIADFNAHAYDAVNILVNAIKSAAVQNSDGSLTISRSAVKDALEATNGYQGMTGTITCTPLGDCATSVVIAVYKMPDHPINPNAKNPQPVFSETKTLAQVTGGASSSP
jgi:branched-chain amino acid transport system substrate-binding protein